MKVKRTLIVVARSTFHPLFPLVTYSGPSFPIVTYAGYVTRGMGKDEKVEG